MRMHLTNGKMGTSDTENVFVYGPIFDRIFNNHIPIYWPMLDRINQRDVTEELDPLISWYDIKKATTKLANEN